MTPTPALKACPLVERLTKIARHVSGCLSNRFHVHLDDDQAKDLLEGLELAIEALSAVPLRPLPMDEYEMLSERERSLQAIGDVIAHWIKWVTREHEEEGLSVTPDTHIMLSGDPNPPHWPSVGQLGRWLQVLRASAAVPQEDQVERLREALEEARDALEPFALLADGANMNDPLSKWFTIAHLKNAETALAASIAALAASPLSVEMGEVERVARALCADLGRQDYGEEWQLDDSLKIAYLDQGEVDFGQLARAAIAALRSSGVDGEPLADRAAGV